ncbi:MAG: hypothetical protein H7177_09540 [Rhizobacter sp.]|nr:hypothetical protein [Bacteriovorax sp.]
MAQIIIVNEDKDFSRVLQKKIVQKYGLESVIFHDVAQATSMIGLLPEIQMIISSESIHKKLCDYLIKSSSDEDAVEIKVLVIGSGKSLYPFLSTVPSTLAIDKLIHHTGFVLNLEEAPGWDAAAEAQAIKEAELKAEQEREAEIQAARIVEAEIKAAEQRAADLKAAQLKALQDKANQAKAAQIKLAQEKVAEAAAIKEKEAQEKAVLEKIAQEKLVQVKAAQEKAAQEKLALRKEAVEKIELERAAREKIIQENLAQKKAAEEKEAQEKAALELIAQEKAAQEAAEKEKILKEKVARAKAAQGKAIAQKIEKAKETKFKAALENEANLKIAHEKATEEKIAQEKLAEKKAAEVKALKEKTAELKAIREKAAQDKAAELIAAKEKAAEVEKDDDEDQKTTVFKMPKLSPDNSEEQIKSDYVAINTKFLVHLDMLENKFNLFSRIKKDDGFKYNIKIAANSKMSKVDIGRIIMRGGKDLYVKSDDYPVASEYFTIPFLQRFKDPTLSQVERMVLNSDSYDILLDVFKESSFTKYTIELIKELVKSIDVLLNLPNPIEGYFNILKQKSLSYGYCHSYLTGLLIFKTIENFTWKKDQSKNKILYLALFHDLSLNNNRLIEAHHNLTHEMPKLTEAEKHILNVHAEASASILEKIVRAPKELTVLIREHHGLKQGNGFLETLSLSISPLSMAFMVTEEFVTSYLNLWNSSDKENVHEFVRTYPDEVFKTLALKYDRLTYMDVVAELMKLISGLK